MDLYLPIANLPVNTVFIIGLGGLVGLLSGMFGVGGGFLTTPLLILYGIPPTVAAASAATQVTGTSVSGVISHLSRNTIDVRMGVVMVVGGTIGAVIGAGLFSLLQSIGQMDTVISLLYVLMLGSIGAMMAWESGQALIRMKTGARPPARKRRHHPLVASLPMRWRFYKSGLYISPLAPLLLGMVTGIMTMLLGVGGGFILVPAMLYLLGMTTQVVVGTSLFQVLFVTMAATLVHSLTTKAVDFVLALLLLIGSVTGAQIGTRISRRMQPEYLRVILAAIVLVVAIRMALGLGWRPDEIYTLEVR
ncbi:UPF0721 transmembrane protein [Sphingobium jiangsuense]|uniref:Probable membrane transporter protein n=1 Tax=Sphingobium jiangsuense TaxID=870476 RepID=A0A7W6FS96_9SPHN|nr:sulfite exporter TauE/SafE family protein [Sphingobium jiangsuense]MBB3928512.1 hypothetical protein [Sphingobium jiangsuense]GLT01540.1 UPF0721 transmembrane protein [Sphingobium jiangsuense]